MFSISQRRHELVSDPTTRTARSTSPGLRRSPATLRLCLGVGYGVTSVVGISPTAPLCPRPRPLAPLCASWMAPPSWVRSHVLGCTAATPTSSAASLARSCILWQPPLPHLDHCRPRLPRVPSRDKQQGTK